MGRGRGRSQNHTLARSRFAMGKKVKVAMISMAHVHAYGYAKHVMENDDAEMVCIWDDREDRAKQAVSDFGVPFVSDMKKAMEMADAVVVNATTAQHKDVYLAAIELGKDIFTEKTLTLTTEDADEVVAAANKAGVKFTVSLPSRTSPDNILMKQLIDEGLIGDITMVRARVAHAGALLGWFEGGAAWFVDEKEAGGGAMFDLGCHTTDLMRWMMGPPKSAVALMNSLSGRYDIDDNSAAVVEFRNGAIGVLDTGFCQRMGPAPFEIYGKDGYIARGLPGVSGLYVESTKLTKSAGGRFTPTRMPDARPPVMDAWFKAILADDPSLMVTTVEDGRNLTQMLEGCYVAWRTGKRHDFSD